MQMHQILAVVVLCLIFGLLLGMVAEPAHAQRGDQRVAQMEGLGSKEFDKDKLPGKKEVALALGSIVAMIAVFKWL